MTQEPAKTTAVDDARKRVEEITAEELDAELRSFGLDPEQVVQNAFSKLCVVLQQKSAKVADLEAQLRQEQEASEHVAWLRYKKRGGSDESYLVLCDSDAPGAFKVYR